MSAKAVVAPGEHLVVLTVRVQPPFQAVFRVWPEIYVRRERIFDPLGQELSFAFPFAAIEKQLPELGNVTRTGPGRCAVRLGGQAKLDNGVVKFTFFKDIPRGA